MATLAAGGVLALLGIVQAAAQTATAAPRAVAAGSNTVEHRVAALARALALDPHQCAQLTAILEAQRTAVARIWSDSTLLPAERAPATRAVEGHTADQIRQILNQAQKAKYNPPQPASARSEPVDVGKWLDLSHATNQAATP